MISVYVVQVFFVHKQLFDLASISKVRILVYAPFVAVPQSSRTSHYLPIWLYLHLVLMHAWRGFFRGLGLLF